MPIKRITEEEKQALTLLPAGQRRGKMKHPLRILLESIKVKEIISVDKEDFDWKRRSPQFFISQISKQGKKRFTLWKKQDDSGWVIERIR